MFKIKRKIASESKNASRNIHLELSKLRTKLNDYIRALERAKTKRELTAEEKRMLKDLKDDIDQAEAIVEKNIDDIKKDVS